MQLRDRVRVALAGVLAPATAPLATHAGPERVLLLRPDHLGDLLLTTPAIAHLRRQRPEAHVALLVGPWNEDAARQLEGIDEVLTCPFPFFDRQPRHGGLAPYRLLREQAAALRGRQFDACLVLRHDHWWGAALAARAGIPQRVGWGDGLVRRFLTHAAGPMPDHESARALKLVEAFTGAAATEQPPMRFAPSGHDCEAAAAWRAVAGAGERYAVIHPGSGGAVKLWTAAGWAAVADALSAQYGVPVIITGSGAEADLVAQVCSGCTTAVPMPLIGVGIGQLGAVLQHACLVLGPDSGVLHLAESVGAPTVRLFGPAPVERFGPWLAGRRHAVVRSAVPCVACGRLDFPASELGEHPCVRSITVAQVVAAAQAVLYHSGVAA